MAYYPYPSDHASLKWYGDNNTYESMPTAKVEMARHLYREHGLSIRQINLRLGLTDREVTKALEGLL